jgi:CO/xanthine dehydrogenase FAD-binding subunit
LQDFEYVAARSIDEAVSLLVKGGNEVRILSGGTDLLVQLREGRRKAKLVVDIKKIPELNELSYDSSTGLRLGAAVTCLKFRQDSQITALYPGLEDAFSLIGGTQIQGRATVGGNVCNASPAADAIPALVVHEAVCEIVGPNGRRELPVKDVCVGPGQSALLPGEILVAIVVPAPNAGFGARYLRFIPRNEMDIAVVGAGASVTLSEDGSTFLGGSLCLGAVAPTPLVVDVVSSFLAGKPVSTEVLQKAAFIGQDAARPINDMRGTVEYRRHLTVVMSRRALEGAVERARLSEKMLA